MALSLNWTYCLHKLLTFTSRSVINSKDNRRTLGKNTSKRKKKSLRADHRSVRKQVAWQEKPTTPLSISKQLQYCSNPFHASYINKTCSRLPISVTSECTEQVSPNLIMQALTLPEKKCSNDGFPSKWKNLPKKTLPSGINYQLGLYWAIHSFLWHHGWIFQGKTQGGRTVGSSMQAIVSPLLLKWFPWFSHTC